MQRFLNIFILSSSVLLILTATAKLISGFGTAPILNKLDPVFLISFGRLLILTAVFEIGVAAVCLFNRNRYLATGLIAMLGTGFLFYRFALHDLGYRSGCPCLGTLTDALGISTGTGDLVMKIALAYLLIGSYTALVCFGMKKLMRTRQARRQASRKIQDVSSEVLNG